MIGKQEKGRSFRGCLKYVLEKAGAERLGGNALGETVDELALEFNAMRPLNADLGVAVYHAMLAVAAFERQTDAEWCAIVADYLKLMGFEKCQYVIVRHTDEEHDHVHVVASRIQIPDGETVSDSKDYQRSETAIRELERTYGLQPVQSSRGQLNSAPSTGEMRRFEKEQAQYEQGRREIPPRPPILMVLQTLISQVSEDQPTMSELVGRLRDRGVEVQVGLTKKQQLGISYQFAGEHYSGTQLGEAYQFGGLQRHRGVNYEPARDDERIRTDLGGGDRIAAADSPADRPVDPGSAAVAEGESSLDAAIEQLDFRPSAIAEQVREFRSQSRQVAADASRFGEAVDSFVEREIFESAEPDFDRVRECLEIDRAAADNAERVRSELAEIAQRITRYLEQLQRDREQAKLEAEEELEVVTTIIEAAEELLEIVGDDRSDGSRQVKSNHYQIEQSEASLAITALDEGGVIFRYDMESGGYESRGELDELRNVAQALKQAAKQVSHIDALLKIAQSFNPERGEYIPLLSSINQAQQQVDRLQNQINPLKRQLTQVSKNLEDAETQFEQANAAQRFWRQFSDEAERLENLQSQQGTLTSNISELERQQRLQRRTVTSGRSTRQREEERLQGIYQSLSEQVQARTGLESREAIEQGVAFVILASGHPQSERNLEALDFSPAVGQWRCHQRDGQSASPYVQKVVDVARRSLYQLRSIEPTVEQTTSTKQSQLEP